MIETETGVLIRQIAPPRPIGDDLAPGLAAERATVDAAALWGLPDFVYRARLRRKGQASRELGDCLLLVGGRGVVVQVKRRATPTANQARERQWIEKKAKEASRQAAGSIRSLLAAPTPATNDRGETIEIIGAQYQWTSVVIIDHPSPPSDIEIPPDILGQPTVTMLRRDWEFLFDQLKSTHAVVGYLNRVAKESDELGKEPARYYQLALADQKAEPDAIDSRLVGKHGRHSFKPLLPMISPDDEDAQAHALLRAVFEDLATSLADIESRLAVLAELDRLAVGERAGIGRALISGLETVADTPSDQTSWRFRRVIRPEEAQATVHLGFGVCSQLTALQYDAFGIWVQLRHWEVQQITGPREDQVMVGVLLSPRHDGLRPWDTTIMATQGVLDLTAEQVAAFNEMWGDTDTATVPADVRLHHI